ncbi:hypothetical protein [Sinorhizobium americanum]|uniref:hypothetical protein n=1 Tax=Sinorhizobium americanum TaxID=194963 RepID=UPI001A9E02E5|nr:hypothetical protein [Sinorhizobium americanum]
MRDDVTWSETDAELAGDSSLLASFRHHLDIRGGIAIGSGELCGPEPGLGSTPDWRSFIAQGVSDDGNISLGTALARGGERPFAAREVECEHDERGAEPRRFTGKTVIAATFKSNGFMKGR